jgi:hypothetical protein
MESEGNTYWQVNRGNGSFGERLRIDDNYVGGIAGRVVDEGDNPTIIFD